MRVARSREFPMTILATILLLAFQASNHPPAPPAPHPRQGEARTFLAAIEGQWRCDGASGRGRPIEADLSFTGIFDGLGVRYVHVVRGSNAYRQESHWGLDRESGHIVSLALAGRPPAEPGGAFYVAELWGEDFAMFTHRSLLSDPFAPNRFAYRIADDRLRMEWEIARNGGDWEMGDFLDCDRVEAVASE